MNFAVILAAGRGQRFGKRKQFALIKDKPVIYYSIKKFEDAKEVYQIIIVTNKDRIKYIKRLIKKYNFSKTKNIIVGGKERQDSMHNALKILPNQGYVVIHDAVRPLIDNKLIKQGFELVKKYQACIPAIPIQDTIKEIHHNVVNKTLNRANLYQIQTPQFFNIRLLKKAYTKAKKEKYYATDDANLVERLHLKVYAIPGLKQNIKITDKTDLKIINSILCNG